MTPRAKTLLVATLVAVPALVYTCPCFGHNGRDADPVEFEDLRAAVSDAVAEAGKFQPVDIFRGITISTDPRTGVRTYTQTGDVPANPARASRAAVATAGAHGVDFWVDKSFEAPASGGGYEPSAMYQPDTYSGTSYVEDYGYGGYYPALGYGYGGGGGRGPGRGHGGGGGGGDGRPDRPGHGGGGDAARAPNAGRWSPPPGPAGGGVGSPPPRQFGSGVGSPEPALRYNSFGGRRR